MAAPVQTGDVTYRLGFGSLSYAGYLPEDGIESATDADEFTIKDERGAVETVVIQDKRRTFRGTFLIKVDSATDFVPPKPGATVTLTPPEGTSTKYRCVAASVVSSRGVARLTLDLIKEASMTYP